MQIRAAIKLFIYNTLRNTFPVPHEDKNQTEQVQVKVRLKLN